MTDRLVARIVREVGDATAIAISRAATPALSLALATAFDLAVVPISGGRTVWAAAPERATILVETPNYVGIEEEMPAADRRVITLRRFHAATARGLVIEASAGRSAALGDVRRLMKRLTSVAGIRPYHGPVVATWFTVLAADPAVLVECSTRSIDATAHGRHLADIPGGVRIELASDVTRDEINRYAAAIENRPAPERTPER